MEIETEASFVCAFVRAKKRERLLMLLQKPSRRRKILSALPHFTDFETSTIRSLTPAEQNSAAIESIMKRHGAELTAYVISANSSLDQQRASLHQMLKDVVGFEPGTILIAGSGIAYFEGEEPGNRFILSSRVQDLEDA